MVEIPVPDLGTANEWSLVLYATGIEHRVVVGPTRIVILVEEARFDDAAREIEAYREENRAWKPCDARTSEGLKEVDDTIIACIILFAVLSLPLSDTIHTTLISIGANESHGILEGHEFWRPITALTLHQDPAHLISNMVIGGVFLVSLIQLVGAPLAWTMTFCAGVAGNILSILIRGEPVTSIGASTSVFGVLGALTGVLFLSSIASRGYYKRPLVYLGTGLSLLSFLGVGDNFTDRTAHLMGFLSGGAMGGLIGFIGIDRVRPRLSGVGILLYAIIITTILAAWYVGLMQTGTGPLVLKGVKALFNASLPPQPKDIPVLLAELYPNEIDLICLSHVLFMVPFVS